MNFFFENLSLVPETREVMEHFKLVFGSGTSDLAKIRPLKNWHSPDFLSGFALWNFASKYPFDVMCQCGLLKYHDPKTKKNKNENTRKDKGLVSFSLIKRTRQNQNQNQNSCSKGGLTLVIFSL